MTAAACAGRVAEGDPLRFRAGLAAPPQMRDRLWPLYAYNLELARAAWGTAEPALAEIRLQWWREAVADAAGGGPDRAHEVAGPLAAVIRAAGLPAAALDAMAAARRREAWREPFADAAALAAHLEATSAGLMWCAARALGAPDAAEPAVRDLGWGAGLGLPLSQCRRLPPAVSTRCPTTGPRR